MKLAEGLIRRKPFGSGRGGALDQRSIGWKYKEAGELKREIFGMGKGIGWLASLRRPGGGGQRGFGWAERLIS